MEKGRCPSDEVVSTCTVWYDKAFMHALMELSNFMVDKEGFTPYSNFFFWLT